MRHDAIMFEHCIYFNTAALARVLERKWSEAFAPLGLTAPQAFTLRMVLAQPGSLQYQLADQLGIARSTLTRLLDSLESKLLLTREASVGDGREVAIYPTPAAKKLQSELEQRAKEVTQTIKPNVGKEVFEVTVKNLRKIRTILN
jgi:DNA-binding MarR family transcriptional regulator